MYALDNLCQTIGVVCRMVPRSKLYVVSARKQQMLQCFAVASYVMQRPAMAALSNTCRSR